MNFVKRMCQVPYDFIFERCGTVTLTFVQTMCHFSHEADNRFCLTYIQTESPSVLCFPQVTFLFVVSDNVFGAFPNAAKKLTRECKISLSSRCWLVCDIYRSKKGHNLQLSCTIIIFTLIFAFILEQKV